MLEISSLRVAINNSEVLRNVTLSVPAGGFVALVGRNGAGKTTLMRATMGLLSAQGGSIRIDGREAVPLPSHARARCGVGYMPEDRRLVPQWTVEENILLPAWASPDTAQGSGLDWIYDLIPEVKAFAGRRATQLSGGQQKLVALARALFCGRRLLLLDEPFEGVAPALAARLVEILSTLRTQRQRSVLVSESDFSHTKVLADGRFVIERGVVERMA